MTYANLSWNRTFDNNKKYVWVTESGSNVCDVCKSLNGKIFSGNKIPPKPHPNCRCAIMEEPVYKNYQEKLKEIKSTVENAVGAEVEKEISRRRQEINTLNESQLQLQAEAEDIQQQLSETLSAVPEQYKSEVLTHEPPKEEKNHFRTR